MRRVSLLLFLSVSGGCLESGSFAPKPNQGQAIDLLWHGLYGEEGPPPPIAWVDADFLWGNIEGYTDVSEVRIAARDMEICGTSGAACRLGFRFSSTSFAHELMHYRTWKRTGDLDPLHFRGDWDLSTRANHELFLVGL